MLDAFGLFFSSPSAKRTGILRHLIGLFLVGLAVGAGAVEPDPNYRKLRDAFPEESYQVKELVLRRDNGVLTLHSGSISFTPPVLGRVVKAVFSGEGDFTLKPVMGMEVNYLKRLINADSIQETFRQAVFCFTDNTYDEIRMAAGMPGTLDAHARDQLQDFHHNLRQRPDEPKSAIEYMLTSSSVANVDAEILADLYNPKRAGFFSAYLKGRKHEDLRFFLKPRGALSFLPAPEEVAVVYLNPRADEEGIWYLSHLSSELSEKKASSSEEKRVALAERYRIETTVEKNSHLTALTELQFRAVAGGDRVVDVDLLPSLRVSSVKLEGEKEIPFIQEERKADSSLHVILPEATEAGKEYRLTFQYAGDRVIHKEGGGNFSVEARTSWYPNLNTFTDRATYDLTFRVPKQYTLVSVGKPVKEWKDDDFVASHWVSEVPLAVAGFNYGSFKKKSIVDDMTKYEIEGYATSETPDYLRQSAAGDVSAASLNGSIIVDTQNAVRVFEAWFGKTPYGRIAVTQQPEFNFGQSWPGLIYLPMSAYIDSTKRWLMGQNSTSMNAIIQEVTPHEVSHQWWGHVVGWTTFHDQWLSEGIADFSAGIFLLETERSRDKFLKYLERARDLILDKNAYGRSPNDAGPIWMGQRLSTFKDARAYSDVVYSKGGYILHMLRMLMFDSKTGDQRFKAMMQDFVKTHYNKSATTESFQAVVEKHMTPMMDLEKNHRMDWFFSQWVYGTEIPRYKFDYTVEPGEGNAVHVKATLAQSDVSDNFRQIVPVYVDFDGRLLMLGHATLTGNASVDMKFQLPQKPKRIVINGNYDVLARK